MARRKKVKHRVGDVVAVPLSGDRRGFGLLLEEPLVAFFALSARAGEEPAVSQIVGAPVAFRVWVMNRPIVDGDWPVIGHADEIPASLLEPPWFFKQDRLSGRITVGRDGSEELPPAAGQVDGLECAAVWSATHVVDRLEDHFAGRPNVWVESMRPRH